MAYWWGRWNTDRACTVAIWWIMWPIDGTHSLLKGHVTYWSGTWPADEAYRLLMRYVASWWDVWPTDRHIHVAYWWGIWPTDRACGLMKGHMLNLTVYVLGLPELTIYSVGFTCKGSAFGKYYSLLSTCTIQIISLFVNGFTCMASVYACVNFCHIWDLRNRTSYEQASLPSIKSFVCGVAQTA